MIRNCKYEEIKHLKNNDDREWASIEDGKKMVWFGKFQGDEVVGCVALRDIGKNKARLNSIYVNKKSRHKGFGSDLVKYLLFFASMNGFNYVETNTTKGQLMIKNGFKGTGKKFGFGGFQYIWRKH